MASGWLQKAQSAVFGRREEPPQPYVVSCECGMTYSGLRASKPQKTACSRCGSSLFIFPTCPYPLPASVEIQLQGGHLAPSVAKETKKAAPTKSSKGKNGNKVAAALGDAAPVKKTKSEPVLAEPSISFGEWVRSAFTPLRITMVALAATVGGTVAITVRNARIESARREVEPAIDRGLKAYTSRDYSTAANELATAVTALDRLGRTDAAARQVRQREKEARAAAGLLTSPLADVLNEILNEKSTESLATRVERRLAGQWLFLDAALLATSASGSRSSNTKLEVDAALIVGKLTCRLEFSQHPGPGWPQPKADALPQRAIFAAQLETIRVESSPLADAVIVLRGPTAVLWTSAEGYAGLIPPPTDEEERKQWQGVLDAQRTALEPTQGTVE
ncbi:MAG: hypothetical protein Q8K78_06315 [Planctomycetaceae bacterium]|nr:hypothetical protein [Planctomycetaceae bacterium]